MSNPNGNPFFKEGNPGGPGRPKKSETYSDTLRELLSGQNIEVTWTINGKEKKLKVSSDKNIYYGIASSQIMEALKGSVQAQKEIVDRIQGKAQQNINMNNLEDISDQFANLGAALRIIDSSTTAKKPDTDTTQVQD